MLNFLTLPNSLKQRKTRSDGNAKKSQEGFIGRIDLVESILFEKIDKETCKEIEKNFYTIYDRNTYKIEIYYNEERNNYEIFIFQRDDKLKKPFNKIGIRTRNDFSYKNHVDRVKKNFSEQYRRLHIRQDSEEETWHYSDRIIGMSEKTLTNVNQAFIDHYKWYENEHLYKIGSSMLVGLFCTMVVYFSMDEYSLDMSMQAGHGALNSQAFWNMGVFATTTSVSLASHYMKQGVANVSTIFQQSGEYSPPKNSLATMPTTLFSHRTSDNTYTSTFIEDKMIDSTENETIQGQASNTDNSAQTALN